MDCSVLEVMGYLLPIPASLIPSWSSAAAYGSLRPFYRAPSIALSGWCDLRLISKVWLSGHALDKVIVIGCSLSLLIPETGLAL